MCTTPLFFLARSHLAYWFLFCLSRVQSYVYDVIVNLWVHCCSCQHCTVYTRVPHQHYTNYCNGPDLNDINPRVFSGDHNHKKIKTRFNTGNVNLYFNTFKLKSVYWQTISYNKICSCLKFSFLSLLIMSKANWLGNQQLAMLTWLMCLHY